MSSSHGHSGSGALPDGHQNSSSAPGSPLYAGQRHSYARSEWSGAEIPEEQIAPTLELPTVWTYMQGQQAPHAPYAPYPQQASYPQQAPAPVPPAIPPVTQPAPRHLPQQGFVPATQEPAPTEPIPVVSMQPPASSPQMVTPAPAAPAPPAPELNTPEPVTPETAAPEPVGSEPDTQTQILPLPEATPQSAPPPASQPAPQPVPQPAPTAQATDPATALASSGPAGPYSFTHVNPQVAATATPTPTTAGFAPPTSQPPNASAAGPASSASTSAAGHPTEPLPPASASPSTPPPASPSSSGATFQAGANPAASTSHTPSATGAKPLSLMAVLSVASGALAFLVSWIPYVSILGYVFSLAALVLGVIAIVQTLPKGKYRGIGLAIAGCALSFSPVIVAIALQALYFGPLAGSTEATAEDPAAIEQSAAGEASEETDANTAEQPAPAPQDSPSPQATPVPQNTPQQGSPAPNQPGTSPSVPSPDESDHLVDSSEIVSVGTGEIADGKMLATITNAAKAGPDDEGRPTVLVTIVLTNKHPRETVTFFDAEMQVYQNGQTLEMSFYEKNAPRGYDPQLYTTDINPGDSKIFHVPFALEDDRSPITVEIGSSFSEGKVAKDFSLR